MSDGLRVDRLPGVGPRYEVGTTDGQRLTVVIDGRGDRHISLHSGRQTEDAGASAVISARQSSLLALILSDTLEIAEAAFSDVAAAEPPPPTPPQGGGPGTSMRQPVSASQSQ